MATIIDKLQTIKDNTVKIYDAGVLSGSITEIFEKIQKGGTRTDYGYAFKYWDIELLKYLPYKDLSKITSATNMFTYVENEIDFSDFLERNNIIFSTSKLTSSINSLYANVGFIRVPVIDISNMKYAFSQVCFQCLKLKTIDGIIFSDTGDLKLNTTTSGVLQNCPVLENVTFYGVAPDGLRIMQCPRLSKQSLLSLFSICSLNDGTTRNVTLPNVHYIDIENEDGTITTTEITTEDFINSDSELSEARTLAQSKGYNILFNI